jgi:hypothetical protein
MWPGDSGSALLKGDMIGGLLFAWDTTTGTVAYANRVQDVIDAVGACGGDCYSAYMQCLQTCPPGCPQSCEQELRQCCHSTALDPNCLPWQPW